MASESKKKILKDVIQSVELHDAGRKIGPPSYKPLKPQDKTYPTLYLSAKEAPFLSGYKVGDKCTIVIKGEVIGQDSSSSKNHERNDYRVEIHEVGQIHHGKDKKGEY